MYRNTPHSTTQEMPAQLMFGRTTRLQFDASTPIKHQQKGDKDLAKDYRNNNNKWQKSKIIKCIGNNMSDVELNNETIWKRYNNQLLIDKSLTPLSNYISLILARKPIEVPNPTMKDETPRPIRSRKLHQRYSPSDFK
ncbi:Ribonuclease H-like domain [Cinara cedri]|uniref:Ribonuclease H-like domain n=1 Tax=Cinara cedri TaxID=506608 RepID=A0A5E4MGQ5_9HEMI|nr:Ribonuclease H-like domain [Cinara cedri]